MKLRAASHAGTWYDGDPERLRRQLEGFLASGSKLPRDVIPAVKVLIGPHAGYSYCGPVLGSTYSHVPATVRRVFVLGPSHHAYFEDCAVTTATKLQTPLGNLTVDRGVVRELEETGLFSRLPGRTDEEEHSIELQLPFLAHTLPKEATVIPIVVGQLDREAQREYARVLSPYLARADTLVVVSTDFCHWGRRFRYQRVDRRHRTPALSIEALDREGMERVSTLEPEAFRAYLAETKNTICGRTALLIVMEALASGVPASRTTAAAAEGSASPPAAAATAAATGGRQWRAQWTAYAQSSRAQSMDDSSVSYAAGAVYSVPVEAQ